MLGPLLSCSVTNVFYVTQLILEGIAHMLCYNYAVGFFKLTGFTVSGIQLCRRLYCCVPTRKWMLYV